jgi:hypothetical protein
MGFAEDETKLTKGICGIVRRYQEEGAQKENPEVNTIISTFFFSLAIKLGHGIFAKAYSPHTDLEPRIGGEWDHYAPNHLSLRTIYFRSHRATLRLNWMPGRKTVCHTCEDAKKKDWSTAKKRTGCGTLSRWRSQGIDMQGSWTSRDFNQTVRL